MRLSDRLPQLRADLERLRSWLRQEIATGRRDLATPAPSSDEGAGHGAAADLYDRELRLTEITVFEHDLDETDAALARMRVGTYGLCVECGRPIPLPRLMARPQAARDVECESAVAREGRRTGTHWAHRP
jgi:DnaK suppressor protein